MKHTSPNVIKNCVTYCIGESVNMGAINDTFSLSLIAIRAIHGFENVADGCCFVINDDAKTIKINLNNKIGRDLSLVFSEFARIEYGKTMINKLRG